MKNTTMLIAACLAMLSAAASAQCSDSEHTIYQRYDKILEAYPNVQDTDLRVLFAQKVGMQPNELKQLYGRCSSRWANKNPDEARAYIKKGTEDLARECASRPSNNHVCKSAFGK